MNRRNYLIDCMRFFAAAMVVFFHYSQPIPHMDNWYRNTVKYGWVGVPVFFMISGYCIMASAHHSAGTMQFLIKRFFRIFPAYWLSLLIVFLAAVFEKLYTGSNSVPNLPVTWGRLLTNLTLTTAPLTRIPAANWVYWTLTYEICFYLVIAIFLLFKPNAGMIWLVIVTAVAAVPQCAAYFFFLDNWMIFCLGICVFYLFRYQGRHKWSYLSILWGLNIYSIISHRQYQVPYLAAVILTQAILILSHLYHTRNTIFSRLGEYSYGIYLIHVPIGIFIFGEFKSQFIQQHVFMNILYDLFTFTITCVLSWKMFRLIELPAQKMGKKFSDSLLKQPSDVTNAC